MKKLLVILLLPAGLALQFCSPSKKASNKTSAPIKTISFQGDVLPLVTVKCAPCHLSTGKKSKIVDYAVAKEEIDDIIKRISMNPGEHGFMPVRGEKLSDSAINVFVQWKAGGLIEK